MRLPTRRDALGLVAAGLTTVIGADAVAPGRLYRRLGIAFGTTVALSVVAQDEREAEPAFAEIRAVDRLSSLTRDDAEVFQLNRDGRLDRPSVSLLQMLRTAALMHEATAGAFDVTIQPLWLAVDAAARRGRWRDDT